MARVAIGDSNRCRGVAFSISQRTILAHEKSLAGIASDEALS